MTSLRSLSSAAALVATVLATAPPSAAAVFSHYCSSPDVMRRLVQKNLYVERFALEGRVVERFIEAFNSYGRRSFVDADLVVIWEVKTGPGKGMMLVHFYLFDCLRVYAYVRPEFVQQFFGRRA